MFKYPGMCLCTDTSKNSHVSYLSRKDQISTLFSSIFKKKKTVLENMTLKYFSVAAEKKILTDTTMASKESTSEYVVFASGFLPQRSSCSTESHVEQMKGVMTSFSFSVPEMNACYEFSVPICSEVSAHVYKVYSEIFLLIKFAPNSLFLLRCLD